MCYTREGDAICCNERHPILKWFQVEPYGKHGLLLFRITVVVVLVQQVVCHTVGGLLMLGFRCDPRFASFPVCVFCLSAIFSSRVGQSVWPSPFGKSFSPAYWLKIADSACQLPLLPATALRSRGRCTSLSCKKSC